MLILLSINIEVVLFVQKILTSSEARHMLSFVTEGVRADGKFSWSTEERQA